MSGIVERLRNCENDPMWADHAEIPKRWCKQAADEIDRLRADNEFLKDGIEKHVEQGIRLGERAETAEAEIDRLQTSKKVLAEREAAMLQMIDELRDEIDRLREALEKIGFADECVGSARDIALKALAKEAGQ